VWRRRKRRKGERCWRLLCFHGHCTRQSQAVLEGTHGQVRHRKAEVGNGVQRHARFRGQLHESSISQYRRVYRRCICRQLGRSSHPMQQRFVHSISHRFHGNTVTANTFPLFSVFFFSTRKINGFGAPEELGKSFTVTLNMYYKYVCTKEKKATQMYRSS